MNKSSAGTAIVVTALLLSSCGGASASRVSSANPAATGSATTATTAVAAPPAAPATTAVPLDSISITEQDFRVTADHAVVATGNVAIAINNAGPSAHELLAFRTDLPEDQLPLGSDGRINEDALPKMLDTQTDLAPGTHRAVSAPLTPGRYVLVCNLPGHYKLGMHFVLTVR